MVGGGQGILETSNFLFQLEPKQTETRPVSILFRSFSRTKQIFSVCFGVSEPFRNEPKHKIGFRNKPKLKINTFLYDGHGQDFFASARTKQTETRSVSVLFRSFSQNEKRIFGFFRCSGTVSKRNETKKSAFRNKQKLEINTLPKLKRYYLENHIQHNQLVFLSFESQHYFWNL
jgi:hypothetical protein